MADVMINDSSLGRPTIRSDYSRSNFPALASSQESRRLVKLNPVSGSSFSSSQHIRFNIPAGSDEVWDPVNSYISFKAAASPATNIALKEVGAPGFFSRATVRNGGNVLEDKQYLPHLANFLSLTSDPSDVQENYLLMGQNYEIAAALTKGAIASPTARFITAGQRFIWPMSEIGVLNTYQYLPLMYMGASGIALEIILEVAQAADILAPTTGSLTSTITISEVEMYLQLVKMRKSWVSAGWEHIAARNNIEIPLTMWECQVQNTTTATTQVVRFTSFAQSMKAMVSILKLSTSTDPFKSWYPAMPIESYQYRLNVDLFPQEPIVIGSAESNAFGTGRAAVELLTLLRQFADYSRGCVIFTPTEKSPSPWVDKDSKVGDRFCLPIALDVHLLGEEDNIISGLNLRDKAAPLEILLKFHGASVTAATLYLLMLKDAKLVINEAGCVVYD